MRIHQIIASIAVGSVLLSLPAPATAQYRGARTSVNRSANVNRNANVNVNRNVNVNVNNNVNVHGGYYGGGCCYHPVAAAAAITATAVVTAAVIGSVVHSVPPSCSVVSVNGLTYQHCGNDWYQPQFSGSTTTYVVVAAPH